LLLAGLGVALGSLALVALAYSFVTRTASTHRPVGGAPSDLNGERSYADSERSEPIRSVLVRPSAIYLCLAGGWAINLYQLQTGHVGYLAFGQSVSSSLVTRLLDLGAGLVTLGMVALALVAWSNRPHRLISRQHAKILLLLNIPLLVGFSLATGVKAQLVTELVPVAVVFVMQKGRLPWKAILAITLYLVISFSGIQQLRADIGSGRLTAEQRSGVIAATTNAVSYVTKAWATESPAQHAHDFWQSLTSEYSGVLSNLTIIVHKTPSDVPYLGVTRLILAPAFFLPTSWIQTSGFSIGEYVNVHYLQGTPTSSAVVTQPGDFYLSGGWPTVIVGELAVGVLLGLLWRYLVTRGEQRHLVLYAVMTTSIANAGSDWTSLSRTVLQTLVVYALIVRVMFPAAGPEIEASRQLEPA
jgi:hypothetical protein